MNELKKTMLFAGSALVLLLLAFVTAPQQAEPEAFSDTGTEFFPDFKDPNTAITLEVIEWDEETGTAVPFKVTFKDSIWTIPSHHDYPADGKDRLAKTAAGLIDLTRDDFRTDNVVDHAACGVIDPLDESSTALSGRGKRVTIKGANNTVLADLIIGKKVEDREGSRFVRLPEQKRVYAVELNIDISTRFTDWIERDLLKADKEKVNELVFKDYSIDEYTGSVNQRDVFTVSKAESGWSLANTPAGKRVKMAKMNDILTTLDELKIVGVRLKPQGLSAGLSSADSKVQLTQGDVIDLQNKGYYFSGAQLLSNEGEVQVTTEEGVRYTLRFGEVVYGSGPGQSAEGAEQPAGGEANRYLFITTDFVAEQFPEPPQPANTNFHNVPDSLMTEEDRRNRNLQTAYEEWQQKVETGRKLSADLNNRFARWYYVISADSFNKLNVDRADLLEDAAS